MPLGVNILQTEVNVNNFYRCSVRSEIYIVHSPTNALFIKVGKV